MEEINEYYEQRDNQKKLEELEAWKEFYTECNNEYKIVGAERQIERIKNKMK